MPDLFAIQSTPWSKTKEKRAKRLARRVKKQLKAQRLAAAPVPPPSVGTVTPNQSKGKRHSDAMKISDGGDSDGADSILEEYRKVKKLRGRKVSL